MSGTGNLKKSSEYFWRDSNLLFKEPARLRIMP